MGDYMFSARARARKKKIVRACDYDGLPCEFCPRSGCLYSRELKRAEFKAKTAASLIFRKEIFCQVRCRLMGARAKL